jgi:peptidoglycan-associated lipoprotein
MKVSHFINLLAAGLILSFATTGCHKRPTPLTAIPNAPVSGNPGEPNPSGPLNPDLQPSVGTPNPEFVGTPLGPGHPNWTRNPDAFKAYTVHFAYDSSAVQSGEKSKVATVADYLKANATEAVEVEGHCDERGTEEYNRALGERRALALREELIALGIDANRVDTISYGEDRPVDPGHDENAWHQNRRGEFVLLSPPK